MESSEVIKALMQTAHETDVRIAKEKEFNRNRTQAFVSLAESELSKGHAVRLPNLQYVITILIEQNRRKTAEAFTKTVAKHAHLIIEGGD